MSIVQRGAEAGFEELVDGRNRLVAGSAENIIKWVFDTYGDKVAIASSFGAEDVVLIDMVAKVAPGFRVFTLDTGRLPRTTYELMDEIQEKYGIRLEVCFPDTEKTRSMVEQYGFNLFRKGIALRRLCCTVRKVQPLKNKLKDLDAWVCGLRRDQSGTRTQVVKTEIDQSNGGIIKINPLADWSEDDVWDYIREHKVPYNRLHDENYPSIGCEPCTRSVQPGEDIRAGRWWWESPENKECGLHSGK